MRSQGRTGCLIAPSGGRRDRERAVPGVAPAIGGVRYVDGGADNATSPGGLPGCSVPMAPLQAPDRTSLRRGGAAPVGGMSEVRVLALVSILAAMGAALDTHALGACRARARAERGHPPPYDPRLRFTAASRA
jgi:hypothetical protein